MNGKKGFVFSIDASFALFLLLVGTSAVFAVIELSHQSGAASLELSRIAGDLLETGKVATSIPDDLLTSKDACGPAPTIGVAGGFVYAKNQPDGTYSDLAPPQPVCIR